jgi:hypothetical protein
MLTTERRDHEEIADAICHHLPNVAREIGAAADAVLNGASALNATEGTDA